MELKGGMQLPEVKEEIANLTETLEKLYRDQESYWQQRGKAAWLKDGDKNTSFFHAKATIRNQTNKIKGIRNEEGQWVEEKEQVEAVVDSYFREIFQSSHPSEGDIEQVLQALAPRLTEEAKQALSQPFTDTEVHDAISSMSPLKSPGPDGYPALFYQKYWPILGSNVISCVLKFLNCRSMPADMNYTYIVLIPKVKNPQKMIEFRPISLCNVIYKIGSKALANRLKPALDLLISPTQSAFVPNRLITDNVLVAFEINHYIRTKTRNNKAFMTLKLDVSKAYDRVEWSFLRRLLLRFGIPSHFVDLIMLAVSSVSFSYMLNGFQFGHLVPERGLRQGDTLSPYLFICVVEACIRLIEKAEQEGQIHGVKVAATAPSVTNLCFADDTMIFCQASRAEALVLKEVLDLYAKASGQVINFEKSSMTFSRGVQLAERDQIAHILGVQVVEAHDKYLGMPSVVGKSKQLIFSVIRERVWKRINGWGEKTLSRAGKEVLIKAVLQSIPTYIMSCFMLPGYLVNSIESAIRSFWWGNGRGNKMAWTSWSVLCKAKDLGGMGFRDLRTFNIALLSKQCWRLMMHPDSLLGRIFQARYFPNASFLEATMGSRPSATWRSIMQARTFFRKGLRVRIGHGYHTAVWESPWINEDGNFHLITPRPESCSFPWNVADIIEPNTGGWDRSLIERTFWPVDWDRIYATPIGAPTVEDRTVWHYSPNGRFTVKSCYQFLTRGGQHRGDETRAAGSGVEGFAWNNIWKLLIPPKIRVFIWRACRNILPCNAELFRRHVVPSPFCARCGVDPETISHTLMACRGMNRVWSDWPFQIARGDENDTMVLIFNRFKRMLPKETFLVALVVCWKAWEMRNLDVYDSKEPFPTDIVKWSEEYLKAYMEAQVVPRFGRESEHPHQWSPPASGMLKLNVDVAFPEGVDWYRVSMVAQNERGECVWWCRREVVGRPSPTVEEAMAVLHGVSKAKEKRWRDVIVETDCLPIYHALTSCEFTHATYGSIIEACLVSKVHFHVLSFSFIRRSGNSIAHALATAQ